MVSGESKGLAGDEYLFERREEKKREIRKQSFVSQVILEEVREREREREEKREREREEKRRERERESRGLPLVVVPLLLSRCCGSYGVV